MQAGEHPHRKGSEVKILTSADGDDLIVLNAIVSGDVRDALIANNHSFSCLGNVRHIQHVHVMRVREKYEVGVVNVTIYRCNVGYSWIVLTQFARPSGSTCAAACWRP